MSGRSRQRSSRVEPRLTGLERRIVPAVLTQPLNRESLYDVLAALPTEHASAGETATTRQKETLDADAEAFELDLDDQADSRLLYHLLSEDAAAGTAVGETRSTKAIETLDETPDD